ncbi:MAG: DNA modification methylase [Planctomycetes bacterium]|nr:DNA modification methylase [Planctomycetota bacterium]
MAAKPSTPTPPVETVPLNRLFCSPTNPRKNDAAIPHVAASLRRFGWQQPIVARRSGEVIAGNTRLKAAQELGMSEVPVWWFDGTDLDATAFAIADNRTHEFAEWNDAELARLLDQLRREDSLDGVGYSTEDIDTLVADLRAQEEVDKDLLDEGPEAPPVVAVAQPGDLWVLGDHRLLCGDSTSLRDVHRVMAGAKAALVATDPPYLVDYTGERPNDSGKDWTDRYREIDIQDAEGFFRAVFGNVLDVLGPKGAIYCWHAHKRCGDIQRIWRDLGILDHQQIIWVKPTPVFGRVYWHFRHEPCVMGWRQGDKPEHDGVHEHDSVWEVDWDGKARVVGNEHPTEKPVELFVRPMQKHTKPGDLVFEPFSGSGSQLIAAERTGRHCRAIEISPPFVDVAVRRWQKATGLEAVLDGDGRTFAVLAAERLGTGTVGTS